jgi:hypothetical protein
MTKPAAVAKVCAATAKTLLGLLGSHMCVAHMASSAARRLRLASWYEERVGLRLRATATGSEQARAPAAT